MTDAEWTSVAVEAYAGERFPQRPLRVRLAGTWQEVTAVEREWREPGELRFVVRLRAGGLVELRYVDAEDAWFCCGR